MATEPIFKFVKERDGYNVFVDGVNIGHVRKSVRQTRIRRSSSASRRDTITLRGWTPSGPDTSWAYYDTRKEAAMHLHHNHVRDFMRKV